MLGAPHRQPDDGRTLSAQLYAQNGWVKEGRVTKQGVTALTDKTWKAPPSAVWPQLRRQRQEARVKQGWLTPDGKLTKEGNADSDCTPGTLAYACPPPASSTCMRARTFLAGR